MEQKDPILTALARIEAKQDQVLAQQENIDAEIKEIRKECRRTAAMYGGLGGMAVAMLFTHCLTKIKLTFS